MKKFLLTTVCLLALTTNAALAEFSSCINSPEHLAATKEFSRISHLGMKIAEANKCSPELNALEDKEIDFWVGVEERIKKMNPTCFTDVDVFSRAEHLKRAQGVHDKWVSSIKERRDACQKERS